VNGRTLPPVRATHDWPATGGHWVYDTWGAHGRPVLLIPAVLFDRSMWWPVAADLRPHATVVAVDLPGHGASSRRHRYDPHEIVDDLAGLTAHLGVTQAPIVVGHGTAAGLAELFATRYATHAVVTVDPEPRPPTNHHHYLSGMAPDAVPARYRHLACVDPDEQLLRDYAACIRARPRPDAPPPAPRSARVTVHSRPPATGGRDGWRHEVYQVPARFPHLADVDRFVRDIRSML
jgi:pimeloyl-ACP methyl ester carboxylesterase